VKQVPEGRVSTYGELAVRLGTSPRAVGQALKRNPHAPAIPCHRVVKADGSLGGYMGMGPGGKKRLLEKEGIIVEGERIDMERFSYRI
jgi:methylated-DNA-[protein]-cysteine S-methyltransferase